MAKRRTRRQCHWTRVSQRGVQTGKQRVGPSFFWLFSSVAALGTRFAHASYALNSLSFAGRRVRVPIRRVLIRSGSSSNSDSTQAGTGENPGSGGVDQRPTAGSTQAARAGTAGRSGVGHGGAGSDSEDAGEGNTDFDRAGAGQRCEFRHRYRCSRCRRAQAGIPLRRAIHAL